MQLYCTVCNTSQAKPWVKAISRNSSVLKIQMYEQPANRAELYTLIIYNNVLLIYSCQSIQNGGITFLTLQRYLAIPAMLISPVDLTELWDTQE